MESGLSKIDETANDVKILKEKVAKQRMVLNGKTEACEKLIEEIEQSTELTAKKTIEAKEKSIEINKQAKLIDIEKVYFLFLF